MNEYHHQDLTEKPQTPMPLQAPVLPQTPMPLQAPGQSASGIQSAVSVTRKMKLTFIIILFLSVLTANFVFLNGLALGFFITVVAAQAVLFIVLPKPASQKAFAVCVFFAVSIIGLGATFFLYSDTLLAVLDFFVLIFLFFLQLLLYSEALPYDWDSPGFFIELLLSPFIRPFIAIPSLFKVAKAFSFKKSEQKDLSLAKRKSVAVKILLGLLIALPVMILVILLLSSADPVFKMIFRSILDFISIVTAEEIVSTLFLAVFCFPFIFSLFYTYLTKWKDASISKELPSGQTARFHLDSVVVATFLFCVNILYGIFAFVQFSALFGAFNMTLPENITYAEYARQGFFQLAAIAFINLVFVVLSVLFTQRQSVSGTVVRVLSVLLVLFTFVQLASAAYRMKMYIDVFSLSKLRVLVSIFMGLIALLLLLALIKEFFPTFKFLKSCMIAAVLVLLFTNYINTNAWIAKYNTTRYFENAARISHSESLQKSVSDSSDDFSADSSTGLSDEYAGASRIDTGYLVNELSFDSIPYMIPLLEAKDPNVASSVKKSLLDIYRYQLKDYDSKNWRRFSLSKESAKKAIETYFGNSLNTGSEKIDTD